MTGANADATGPAVSKGVTTSVQVAASAASPEGHGSKASGTWVVGSVDNVRVFSARDVPLYAFLSLLNLAAVVWVMRFWVAHAEWSAQTPAYVFLTGAVLLPLAMFESRWVVLPIMRRPKHMPASPGRRVGVATTFVPGGEDVGMLEAQGRTIVISVFTGNHFGSGEMLENAIGLIAKDVAEYFAYRR